MPEREPHHSATAKAESNKLVHETESVRAWHVQVWRSCPVARRKPSACCSNLPSPQIIICRIARGSQLQLNQRAFDRVEPPQQFKNEALTVLYCGGNQRDTRKYAQHVDVSLLRPPGYKTHTLY